MDVRSMQESLKYIFQVIIKCLLCANIYSIEI